MLTVTQLVGFGAAPAGGAITGSFIDSKVDSVDRTTYNFDYTTLTEGDMLVAALAARGLAASDSATSSVSFGGAAGTLAVEQVLEADSGDQSVSIYWGIVPSTPTGIVSVTYAGGMLRAGSGLFKLEGANASSPVHATNKTTTADPMSTTVNVVAGGCVIAVSFTSNSLTTTWTGVGEEYDEVIETTFLHSGGFLDYTAAQSPLTVEADLSGTPSASLLAVASFTP